MSKIGITEAGDASRDFSWEKRANEMDMMILITKHVTEEFIERVLPYKNKTIVHATCTGLGRTGYEPNVPDFRYQISQAVRLIEMGFPKSQVVLRVDPLIPFEEYPEIDGVRLLKLIVANAYPNIERFRISVLDNYKHVQKRFADAGLPVLYNGNFSAPDKEFARLDAAIIELKRNYPNISIECCAEPKLKHALHIGCASAIDLSLFGLRPDGKKQNNRYGCLCEAKTELLPYKHYWWCTEHGCEVDKSAFCKYGDCKTCDKVQIYGCANRCLYCYWRT